jgi:hypothetical protein
MPKGSKNINPWIIWEKEKIIMKNEYWVFVICMNGGLENTWNYWYW